MAVAGYMDGILDIPSYPFVFGEFSHFFYNRLIIIINNLISIYKH